MSMNNNPIVSVVIPVYNVEKYLAEALTSVRVQSYKDFEAIIVNDESPDNSLQIAEAYAALDSRFRVISQENRGLAGARNTGIRYAKGQYVGFLDSDDYWHPDKLLKHIQHLEADLKLGVSYCRSEFVDERSHSIGTYQMPKLKDIDPGHLLCRNPVGNGSAPVIRKAALDDIAFCDVTRDNRVCYFDEDLRQSEDVECWFRILSTTPWLMEGIPEALTYYRVNNSGLSADMEKQFQTFELFHRKAALYAPKIVEECGNLAKAYQYRYLSRRAVRSHASAKACTYLFKALKTDPRIIIFEPRRTFLTLTACMMLVSLPQPVYKKVENMMMELTGANQSRLIKSQEKT